MSRGLVGRCRSGSCRGRGGRCSGPSQDGNASGHSIDVVWKYLEVVWNEPMETTSPQVPWWHFALAGLVMVVVLGTLLSYAIGWLVQIAVVLLLLVGVVAFMRRRRP